MEETLAQTPAVEQEETVLDTTLRPKTLFEFIGQNKIKQNLGVFMEAARQRSEPLEHVLLYGNPGLGKTTLAYLIAHEMKAGIRVTSGPALERIGDLAAILTNLQPRDVLFIDEVHRLPKIVEEVLYPAMEEFALDIIVGKGPTARTLRLDLPRITIIGATTRMSLLSAPLRDRFGTTFAFAFYEEGDIKKIILRSARLLNLVIDDGAATLIASRARRTPRVANRLLRRVRDFAQVHSNGTITPELAKHALEKLEIDTFGLEETDRRILAAIITKFRGGPVGIASLAAATREEPSTIEDIYEPFLMQIGLLERTPRGRMATALAFEHLGHPVPLELQKQLL